MREPKYDVKNGLEAVLDEGIRNNWENPKPEYVNVMEEVINIYERYGHNGKYYRITAYEMRKKIYRKL